MTKKQIFTLIGTIIAIIILILLINRLKRWISGIDSKLERIELEAKDSINVPLEATQDRISDLERLANEIQKEVDKPDISPEQKTKAEQIALIIQKKKYILTIQQKIEIEIPSGYKSALLNWKLEDLKALSRMSASDLKTFINQL